MLLDTHILIWLFSQPSSLSQKLLKILSVPNQRLHISTVSAWEIGTLIRKDKLEPFQQPWREWIEMVWGWPNIIDLPLSRKIMADSTDLPGQLHNDPMDRLLIATAREHHIPIITADRKIIDYAKQGYIEVIA